MTQQEKDLLLRDLCARLPHGVMVNIEGYNTSKLLGIDNGNVTTDRGINYPHGLVKPYLRPMSSMTKEELHEYRLRCRFHDICGNTIYEDTYKSFDYLHSIHVDYRGLISKGLAIAVTEENNSYKNNF